MRIADVYQQRKCVQQHSAFLLAGPSMLEMSHFSCDTVLNGLIVAHCALGASVAGHSDLQCVPYEGIVES